LPNNVQFNYIIFKQFMYLNKYEKYIELTEKNKNSMQLCCILTILENIQTFLGTDLMKLNLHLSM